MRRVSLLTQMFSRFSLRAGAAGLLLALLVAGAAPPNTAFAASFAIGDILKVDTPALNLRSGPGTGNGVVAVLAGGSQVTITDGPVAAEGYTWYAVTPAAGGSGWLIGEGLAPTGSGGGTPGDSEFAPGTQLVVNTDALNLRTSPALQAAVVVVLPNGTEAVVVSGAYVRDGYAWYELDANGNTGFAVSDFLALAGSGGGDLPPGDSATVATDALNVRVNVSLGATVVAVLPWGTAVSVLAGPIDAEGYTWYRIASSAGNGWAAGEFLSFDSGGGGGTPGGITVGGSAVVSDGPLNLRESAGTGAIITTLPTGTTLSVTGGPVTANSYTWFSVTSTTYGSGWVASEFLQPA